MKFLSRKGAGQTEYILIVVLIAITVMFSVSRYGKEVRSLFKKTNKKLTLMDGDSKVDDSNDQGGSNSTVNGEEEQTPITDNSTNSGNDEQTSDQDKELEIDRAKCQRLYNDLQREKRNELRVHNNRITVYNNLQNHYDRLADYYYSQAKRYRWIGWWGFWRKKRNRIIYWNNQYLSYSRRYRNYARQMSEKIDAENERHNAFLENWNLKMEQWEKECGGNP